jgi:hypothetical protein
VRLWSAEVWCRSTLAGQSIEQIEQELWLDGPASSAHHQLAEGALSVAA